MAGKKATTQQNTEKELARFQAMARKAPFVLRLTRISAMEPPVLVVKERILPEDRDDTEGLTNPRAKTVERGTLHGEAVRACLPILRRIVAQVKDDQDISLGLERFMNQEGLRRSDVNFPLDETAGARLALFFRLQAKIQDISRIELLGRRVMLFSREEAVYWLSNITASSATFRSWAVSGLRTMLCGESGDKRIGEALERIRAKTA